MLYLRLFGLCGQTYADGGEYRCCKCKRMHRAEHDRGDKTCRTADDGYDSKHGCSLEPALLSFSKAMTAATIASICAIYVTVNDTVDLR